jgi:hypothetical protein
MSGSMPASMEACVYFTRLTVSEDGLYLPLPHDCRVQFLAACPHIPTIRTILCAYADRFAIDLLTELVTPTKHNIDKRVLEAGMYAAFAFFLEDRYHFVPSALAFYSSGIAPALMFAKALSPDDYLARLAPFHSANRAAYLAVEKRLTLAQTRLEADITEDLESFVERALDDELLKTRVYIKDRRHRHTLLLAGVRSDVEKVRKMAMEAFSSVARQSPKLVDTSSAHLPLYDRAPLEAMLENIRFDIPRFTLIGIDGQTLFSGTRDQAAMRRVVSHAAMGFMDTGRVVREAAKLSNRTVVVGSPFGARVLDRTHLGGYPVAEPATNRMRQLMTV